MEEARLPVISLSRLFDGDLSIIDSLLSACQEYGFFYLNYQGTKLARSKNLYFVAEDFFDLSLEEKMKYDVEARGPEKYDG